jgi:hypothetical protein
MHDHFYVRCFDFLSAVRTFVNMMINKNAQMKLLLSKKVKTCTALYGSSFIEPTLTNG